MRRLFRSALPLLLLAPAVALAVSGVSRTQKPPQRAAQTPLQQPAPQRATAMRPRYDLSLNVNYQLLMFTGTSKVTIPVRNGETLRDAVFFLYANADGVGNATREHPNISVDSVALDGAKVPFKLDGAVLRVTLPQAQTGAFTLEIKTRGVVPRSPNGAGGLMDMMGGMDLGGLMGASSQTQKKNADYGLYTFGDGVLSLGSFWYPQLAVRQNSKWMDEAPEGLGDVGFAEMSDFDVSILVADDTHIVATGKDVGGFAQIRAANRKSESFRAQNVRDFAVLMSRDWQIKSKTFDVGGKPVRVSTYVLKRDAARADETLEIAGRALQIYAKRFGPYIYDEFKVVQGPIRGGAGGMEFSGLTSIASGLYGDLGKQLGDLAGALGGNLNMGALNDLIGEEGETASNPAGDMLNGVLGQQKAVLDSMLEATIAHEVAHQWWAMAVGSDSLRAPWLDEALTNYSAMLYFEDRYGAERAAQMRDLHLKQTYATARMLGAADAPANLKTAAYQGNLQYGAVIYGKAALFYDAVRRELGDEAFFGALRDYYRAQTGELATGGDLLDSFARRAPNKKARVTALYQRWITQAHGDADVTGGQVQSVESLLGGLLGGGLEGE